MLDESAKRIFVALDTSDLPRAINLTRMLKGQVGGMKIGKEFFTAHGPAGVTKIVAEGLPVFLDLKFHDIPNTVAAAVRASISLKPFILNVHAVGGRAMMEAARVAALEESQSQGVQRPLLLGVTVLTSLDESDLKDIGFKYPLVEQSKRLAEQAQQSGLDGVVCSAAEIEVLRTHCGPEFKLLTPGIRPSWAAVGDQKRAFTPSVAISSGSDFLVIGRPITTADDPIVAANLIVSELRDEN